MRPSEPLPISHCQWSPGDEPLTNGKWVESMKDAMCPGSGTPVTRPKSKRERGGKGQRGECGRAEALCSHDPPGG